ncbi:MAG: hypothetical protein ACK5EA_15900 [Planctomycetaceae bacterium]
MLKIIQAKIDFPDHPSIDAVFRHWFSDPDDLPDLSRLSSPGGNSRPGGDCQLPFQPPVSGRLARALLSSAQGLGSAADLGSPSTEGQAECCQPSTGVGNTRQNFSRSSGLELPMDQAGFMICGCVTDEDGFRRTLVEG